VQAASPVPLLLEGEYNLTTLTLLLGLFAVFLLAAHTVAFHSMRRLFSLDVIARWQRTTAVSMAALLQEAANPARGRPGRKRLILYPPPELLSALKTSEAWSDLNAAAGNMGRARYVQNLTDVLADEAALQRIAAAASSPGNVILLASADPFRRLPEQLTARWAQALEPFEVVRAIDIRDQPSSAGDSPGSPETPAPMSRARCERLWEESDEAERRIMGQLAIDGYANPAPENIDTLQQLTARGIIGKHNLTFASESFGRFVRSKLSISELDRWQQADGGSVWNTVRVPLMASVAAAVAIFGTSAPELTATGAALVPTIAAGFPVLLRILLSVAQSESAQE
jgi:hypothetical protein